MPDLLKILNLKIFMSNVINIKYRKSKEKNTLITSRSQIEFQNK